jgi:hypothetical protein
MKEKFIAKRTRSSHIGSLQGAQRTKQDQNNTEASFCYIPSFISNPIPPHLDIKKRRKHPRYQ